MSRQSVVFVHQHRKWTNRWDCHYGYYLSLRGTKQSIVVVSELKFRTGLLRRYHSSQQHKAF